MKCRKRIMTVCKQAYRNLKLQTNEPLYLVGPQKIKKKVWVQRQWMAWQENLYHFWGILIFFLPSMVTSGMCHLVIFFPNIYHSGEEGALITFVYIQIRHPSHSFSSVFVQHFWRPGLLWLGVNRTGQPLKTTPAQLLAHLSRRLRGELLVYQWLRRPASGRPSVNIFKHPLLWNHWANWTQISYGDSLGWGNESLFKCSWSHDQDGRHAQIW